MRMLTVLAESQQATVSADTLSVYSKGLECFREDDLRGGIGDLSLRERPDGKTAFPSLPQVITAVQRSATARCERVKVERQSQERAYALANPETRLTFSEFLACRARLVARRARGEIIPIPEAPRFVAKRVGGEVVMVQVSGATQEELDNYVAIAEAPL